MEIKSRHIGGGRTVSNIIELIVTDGGSTIIADVVDLKGKVDEQLIQDLRDIADELEEQNKNIEDCV